MRRRGSCLLEPADDGSPRQFDLEAVMGKAGRTVQNRIRSRAESFPSGRLALEIALGLGNAPRLMRDPAKRDARLLDGAAFELQTDGDGNQREGVGQPIPDLQVGVVASEAVRAAARWRG